MLVSEQVAQYVDMLPSDEQIFALEFVKRLVLAWDPNFTKLTPNEASALVEAEQECARGETVSHADINWE